MAFLTPEQEAALRASVGRQDDVSTLPLHIPADQMVDAPVMVAPPALVPDQSIAGRIRGSLGRALQNPVTDAMLHPVAPLMPPENWKAIGQAIAPENAVKRPGDRDITGFQRDNNSVQELQPMATPDVNVQAAPALSAKYGAAATSVMGPGMGVGGGVGGGLATDIANAQKGQLGAIGREGDAQSREGVAAADRNEWTADMDRSDAQKAQQMYADRAALDAEVNKGVDDFFRQNDRMASEVAQQKVDSNRLFKNMGAAQAVTLGIGAVLGGMMAGLQGGDNKFMDHIDRMVDRDVNDQRSAIESKRAGLAARQNMYGQLLQQTGDRRLADLQLRNLQLEAIKQETKARADALKTPEILAQSDKIRAGIDLKQDALRTAMLEHKQQQLQAQAAAAAAARMAAVKYSDERQDKIAELGLKKDQLTLEQRKADIEEKKAVGDVNKETAAMSKELSDPKLAQGRAAVEQAKGELAKVGPNDGLPGIGPAGDFRAGLKPEGINSLNVGAHLVNKLAGLSDQERVNRQNWDSIKLQYQQQITGSGASEKEREMLSKAFEGAKTPAEQRNAIAKAAAVFSQVEKRTVAGYSPAAVQTYKQRLAGQK